MTMQSFASRLMPFAIRLRGSKKRYASAEVTLAKVASLRLRPKSYAPPKNLDRTADVVVRFINGWPVYDVTAKGARPTRRAIYLHGGSNVYEISSQHWQLVAELAASTDSRITVPIYPLAPQGTARLVVAGCADLAEHLIDEVGASDVTILGDSAGGGMALATALVLRDRGNAPSRVVLISPVLDLSLSDPELSRIVDSDPWLDLPGAKATSELYRGSLPFTDPRVSPLFGDLPGVGPILMLSGTRDMLNADAHRLVEKAAASAHPLEYHEVAEMIHVYPLLPIPEARVAREQIREFMTRTVNAPLR